MKFPYKSFTEKELARMEGNYWCISMGGDFILSGDHVTLTQKEISKLYNETINDLVILARDGSERDRKYAIDLIGSLRIVPFRLH